MKQKRKSLHYCLTLEDADRADSSLIDVASIHRKDDCLLVKRRIVGLTGKDLNRLNGRTWLNDECVNAGIW